MAASAKEYNLKLQEELQRAGTSRDEAVRRTNVALGYGNSTALQHEPEPQATPKDDT